MTINISEILANPSVVREYTVEPSFEMLELKQGVYPVSRKESFVLTVSRKDKKVHVTGDTVVCLLIPCDRCLDDVEVSFPIHIDSLWSPDETAEGIGDVDEITFMDGCILDV
ncbi:MAG: DUF177 domain-containing protein, partial [Eubacteriales bacterium]|nr:DUF177 domain-containing protein [Eubacteriales bacterium]